MRVFPIQAAIGLADIDAHAISGMYYVDSTSIQLRESYWESRATDQDLELYWDFLDRDEFDLEQFSLNFDIFRK